MSFMLRFSAKAVAQLIRVVFKIVLHAFTMVENFPPRNRKVEDFPLDFHGTNRGKYST